MFNFLNERNKTGSVTRLSREYLLSLNDTKHPLCLGDGFDDCGYNSKIDCGECKFGGGTKDPRAKRNQFKEK